VRAPGTWVTIRARTWLPLALAALAGCTGGDDGRPRTAADTSPVELPERFGFGTPADPARIAAWDIDVRPDGTGLPPGSGSVDQGALAYQARCAACHGPTGVEGPNNRLVGTEPWTDFPGSYTVGAYWPYATTLYDYIRRAMPLEAPGSLTADETYAVIAWILHRNDIVPADAVMNATTLPQVRMPMRDRFVPDDRLEVSEVR
jgi:S-disulfanyl-L-cysteine oxidoreductase SoxD